MKTVCELNKCAGCMACVDICPKGAIKIKDSLSAYNAEIDENKCIGCNACHKVCQANHPAKAKAPIDWHQGWTENAETRKECSSGGAATAISKGFLENGGIVCGCTFNEGKFIFEFAENEDELKKFIGSKYVKSDPMGIYKEIKSRLKREEKVLFIGLPCQVAALKNYVSTDLSDKLYTIDLICHGTPSPKVLNIFLKQYGLTLSSLKDIKFRVKAKFQIYGDYKGIITKGVSDRYSIAFLNALTYTENCYRCPYAKTERVSDVTLGDSWGSELAMDEQKNGISLILNQTEKGNELLKMANLHLEAVDIKKAIASNHQLEYPSFKPKGREKFFDGLKDRNFNSLVFRQLPKQCLRQDVKKVLIKLHIIDGGGGKLNYNILVYPLWRKEK